MGCYRKTDANDPHVYAAAVVSVLTRYSPELAIAVTEPATGLPSKAKWLPAIAEIVEACESRREMQVAGDAEDRWQSLKLEAILSRKADQDLAERREKRLSLDELRAKYPPKWGLSEPPDPRKFPQKTQAIPKCLQV